MWCFFIWTDENRYGQLFEDLSKSDSVRRD